MSLSVRWHRLEAATWLHRLLVLQVVLLGVATVVAFFAGLALGAPLLVLFPLVLTGVAGWFAQAWREERRWSWWAVLAVTALDAGWDLLGLTAGPSFWRVAWLLFDAVLVTLMVHPDSTARLGPRPRRRTPDTG